jgi:hypothetical protein
MIARLLTTGLLLTSAAGHAQSAQPELDAMLKRVIPNTFKLSGTCKRLMTPEGDQTKVCEKELINVAFASGNSSFIATMKNKGGIAFRGRDSAAKGDVATIRVNLILLTKTSFAPAVELKSKGQCTYTNPNKGPLHVECTADTANGKYELSYVSNGVWPPK